MNILIAILVLGIIIFIHELGHFLTAKFFKMPVSEFSIGMGPQVYSYETMKTTYSFRAIPLGGFLSEIILGAIVGYIVVLIVPIFSKLFKKSNS